MTNKTIERIFIAGGYGMIGSNIARQLRQRFPASHIIIAGRNPSRGEALVQQLGNASVAQIDLSGTRVPDDAATAQLIISAVPDPKYLLAEYAIGNGIAFINITSASGDDILPLLNLATVHRAARPVVPLGYYEAGMFLPLVTLLSQQFTQVKNVEMAALHDPADPLGTLSSEELGNAIPPALMRKEGYWIRSDAARQITLADGKQVSSVPFTVLDITAVAAMTAAKSVSLSVASDVSVGSRHNGQPSIDLYVDMHGIDTSGKTVAKRLIASDPHGQAHFTAFGVLMVIEGLLAKEMKGVVLPEEFMDMDQVLRLMADAGISVTQH